MPDLYPLLLAPDFYHRVWGTRDLSPIYRDVPGSEPIGEVWLTGDACKVTNGFLVGSSLSELCKRFGRELIGERAQDAGRFPLLIKFLFPREKLSVQVHPDDEGAHALGQPCGKTECWYVLQAQPGAKVAVGLKPGTSKTELELAIRETRAEELLNWMNVYAGEMVYVDAGTVHAIGPGSILVETQQNSDTTFRLYDYGRPRELHVEQGLQAVKERTHAGKVKTKRADAISEELVMSRCFAVSRHDLPNPNTSASIGTASEPTNRSVQILVGLTGGGSVEADDCEPVKLGAGIAVVIPACIPRVTVRPAPHLQLLSMYLPFVSFFSSRYFTILPTS